MSLKQLLIFPFQYLASLPHVIFPLFCTSQKLNQLELSITCMLNKRYINSIKGDICCFDFLSSILVLISFLLNIGKERKEVV